MKVSVKKDDVPDVLPFVSSVASTGTLHSSRDTKGESERD